MTELKDIERELGHFRGRLLAAAAFVLLGFVLLGARLFHLQVLRHDELARQAEVNRTAVVPIVPNRGLIVDRNGVVLASNYSAYTLEITPSRAGPLEPLIDELATLVEITPRDRRRFRRLMEEGKSFESLPLRTKLAEDEVARFTAQRFRFPGVEVKARLFRSYPLGETGSHLLGYIGRINQTEKKAMDDWPDEEQANYKGTEYIGKLGLEQAYERDLHGQTGFERMETSAGGRAVRRLASHGATPGHKLVLSVDIKLQALVEQMFGERRGALVAIDPRNGELLAFVSKPTFDPNLFVDGIDVESWRELSESIDKPLLNRALRGTYPPGSTFKPFMAMAALTSGKRAAGTVIHDGGSFQFGNHTFRSHGDVGLGAVDMARSIVKSSNVYYYSLANEMGVDLMHAQLSPFGFGRRTDIDLEGEVTGVLPSTEWKRRAYRRPEQQRWYAGETISLGIGQGYNNFTMLQLASATATLVSGGLRFKPHLVREIEDVVTHERRRVAAEPLEPLPLKPEHVELIRQAMHGVTQEGTSTRVFAGAPYKSGGKTGTAQAVGVRQNERYNAAKLEEHQRDHSLYIAMAPLDAPTVALAVIVENAGFGAAAAAPMARRVFDYLLLGQYPSEEDMAALRAGKAVAPAGTPRRAEDVPLPGAGLSGLPPVAVAAPLLVAGAMKAPR
ncbi:penicillin-binding protein 2 [Pseudorhodoferax sp.]|uniref:penicillin-binding protein 2 n=1 Tax=Pseudorhodoferax sp. TaxID=1993553 RepID=UPI002DD618DD|nr:penicillin-binding protein 2 [Pseudorhodoferax sp.]